MSDHEGEDYDGFGRSAPRQRKQTNSVRSAIVPGPMNLSQIDRPFTSSPSTGPQTRSAEVIQHSSTTRSANVQTFPQRTFDPDSYRARRPNALMSMKSALSPSALPSRQASKAPVGNEGVKSFNLREPPADIYQLPIPWKVFVAGLGNDRRTAYQLARGFLDQIGNNTGTYIQTPDVDSFELKMWGNEQSVSRARLRLETFMKTQKSTQEGPHKWAKYTAFDGRREHRATEGKLNEANLAFNDLTISPEFNHHSFMIWPKREGFSEYQEYVEANWPEDSRRTAAYRITFRIEPIEHVFVQARDRREVLAVHYRLTMIAAERKFQEEFQHLVTLNTLNLPAVDLERGQIKIVRDTETSLFLPTLVEAPYGHRDEEEKWGKIQRRWNRHSRKLVQNQLDRGLRALQTSSKHVRMRVTFGNLGLHRFKKSASGGPIDVMKLKDFCESFADTRTQVKQIPLNQPNTNMAKVIAGLNRSDLLESPMDHYSSYYDFKLSAADKTLRLESEFRFADQQDELEMCGQRWLEFDDISGSETVKINRLDLDRPSVQFHVGAVRGVDERAVSQRLASFRVNIGFRPYKQAILSGAGRKSLYPHGYAELVQLTEIFTKRYPMKVAGGMFELRRVDRYAEKPAKGVPNDKPLTTTWNASYYYTEWDNLMGQMSKTFAESAAKPEQQFGVGLFFQEGNLKSQNECLPTSFRDFMKEIDQLQDMLGEVLSYASGGVDGGTEQKLEDLLC